jgi:hypothetical protein
MGVMETRVFVKTGEVLTERDLLEFRLLYQGKIESGGNKSAKGCKHAIRRSLHPQMRRLWNTYPGLRQFAIQIGRFNTSNPGEAVNDAQAFSEGICRIGKNWSKAGYDFVPLVTSDFALRCSIDILLLRPEEKKFIFERGDIDGQVKTLFDALRSPENFAEVGIGPQEDETPFYCLLSDDKLISEVRVSADQLLLLPGHKAVEANDSFAVIHVKVNHKGGGMFDRWFD